MNSRKSKNGMVTARLLFKIIYGVKLVSRLVEDLFFG